MPGESAPADDDRQARLGDLLRASADPDGFVPFDRFMDLALYGEGVGYYTRPDTPFGRSGDYYTAAHASPLFGRTVGERVRRVLHGLPRDSELRVVELGPGDGTLAGGVLAVLDEDPALRGRTQYTFVDRVASLSASAFDRISSALPRGSVRLTAASGLGADGPFRGVVLANEVLDAQPARRLRWDGSSWRELGVRVDPNGGWQTADAPLRRPLPAPELPVVAEEGATLEVSPMAEGIVREAADHLTEGLFVVIDYGMSQSELLAAHPAGTLATIRKHRSSADPLLDPGGTDLSVFVNFDRIRFAARSAGLVELEFRSQAEALAAWGVEQTLSEAVRAATSPADEVRLRLGVKNLLFGFERFRVLELAPPSGAGTNGPTTT